MGRCVLSNRFQLEEKLQNQVDIELPNDTGQFG